MNAKLIDLGKSILSGRLFRKQTSNLIRLFKKFIQSFQISSLPNKSLKIVHNTGKLDKKKTKSNLSEANNLFLLAVEDFQNLTDFFDSKQKMINLQVTKFIKDHFLELSWQSLNINIQNNLKFEKIISENQVFMLEKSKFFSFLTNFSIIKSAKWENSKVELLCSITIMIIHYFYLSFFSSLEINTILKKLRTKILKILRRKNKIDFELKKRNFEILENKKTVDLLKIVVPKRPSFFSDFNTGLNLNSTPIIQTFPSESFKKSQFNISSKFNSEKNSQKPTNNKMESPTQNSILGIKQAELNIEFPKNNTQATFVSKCTYEKTRIKFPEPKEIKGCQSDAHSLQENTVDNPHNWQSIQENRSLDGVSFIEARSPSKNPLDKNSFQDSCKFFGLKTIPSPRKMTGETYSPKLTRKILASVSEYQESKLVAKIEPEKGIFTDNKIERVPEFSSQSVVSFKTESVYSKNSGFRIEKMVSVGSINSAVESLLGKAVLETVEELKTHSEQLKCHRLNLKSAIIYIIGTQFPDNKIEVEEYGSFATGLLTPYSDMDLCLRNTGTLNKVETNVLMAKLLPFFKELAQIVSIKHIETASIPVIKIIAQFSGSEEIQVDLTVETIEEKENGSTAFRTTAFICDCIRAYPSFKPVVLFMKYILNLGNLSDSYKGKIKRRFERIWIVCFIFGILAN